MVVLMSLKEKMSLTGRGAWHKRVPKDFVENLQFRRHVLAAARGDRAMQRAIVQACREDILFFINVFVWQYNPKKKGEDRVGPFVTWDFQDRALIGPKGILDCYALDRTCVVEKSRELGASWLLLIVQVWLCLFHPYVECFNISRSAEAVDSNSRKSLFAKIRFINDNLPRWLTGKIVDQSFYFHYERTKSEIAGEASTGSSGSGGRATLVNVDEFPEIKADTKVRQNTASISDCRFFTGTHLGVGTEFYNLTITPEIVKIQMHWTQHPDKNKGLYSYDVVNHKRRYWEYSTKKGKLVELNMPKFKYGQDFEFVEDGSPLGGPFPGIRSPWYDKKAVEIGNRRQVAMELDIDPKGAASQFFDPLMISHLKTKAESPWWEGELLYDQDGNPKELAKTVGGPIKLWCKLDGNNRPPIAPYGAGTDVSGGVGTTPSCLSFVNGKTGEKILEYMNAHIDPKEFATFAVALCRLFQDGAGTPTKIAWEHHGSPGAVFGNQVIALGFRNFYYDEPPKSSKVFAHTPSNSPGWRPMGANKKILLLEYSLALRDGHYQNRSESALDDCLLIKYDNRGDLVHSRQAGSDPEAARENHADIVIADALGYKMVSEQGTLASVARVKEEVERSEVIDERSFAGRLAAARRDEEVLGVEW